jgi:GntR family transcriptional regulator
MPVERPPEPEWRLPKPQGRHPARSTAATSPTCTSRSRPRSRRAIAEGEAKPGERLPPARDLAAILGVNRNTVLRALRDLRDEGLLDFRRGRGVTVSRTPPQGAVHPRARELLELARRHGYRREELVHLIETLP